MKLTSAGIALVAMLIPILSSPAQTSSVPGTTRVATWKDDKKGAFLLMFDDSIPTDIQTVIPELQKRGLIGTFYVNPGSGQWKRFANDWEKTIPATGMVYADHTMTHSGFKDLPNAEEEIGKCNDIILQLEPGAQPHLVSFGLPGGVPIKVTKEELNAVLAKNHLIDRPPFNGHGATVNLKDSGAILKLADDAMAKGEMEYVVFHGVGGDWIVFPTDEFIKTLDGLVARQDQLWITDHISGHKYATERTGAKVEVTQTTDQLIQMNLKTDADPQLYDLPLTLVTEVPATWTACDVVQSGKHVNVAVSNGTVKFEALPGNDPISLAPATASK